MEKAHSDVLNILLQILEDGMLTDGKGRTVDFSNVILVMTSNVGSKRILELANRKGSRHEEGSSEGIAQGNGIGNGSVEPITPDQVLSKLQNSPRAMNLMMEAMADSDFRMALQTAIGRSPADLLKEGRENPKVAKFLEELWSELDMQGERDADDSFASGVFRRFQNMLPNGKEWSNANGSVNGELCPGSTENVDSRAAAAYAEMVEVVKEELENELKPELLNRIDEIVVFSPLRNEDLRSISKLILEETIRRARDECDIHLHVSDELIDIIMEEGSANASTFGARPMRRAVQRFFEDTVSDVIIRGFLSAGDRAVVQLESDGRGHPTMTVKVTRERDGESMLSYVENIQGGIGVSNAFANASHKRPMNPALETNAFKG